MCSLVQFSAGQEMQKSCGRQGIGEDQRMACSGVLNVLQAGYYGRNTVQYSAVLDMLQAWYCGRRTEQCNAYDWRGTRGGLGSRRGISTRRGMSTRASRADVSDLLAHTCVCA